MFADGIRMNGLEILAKYQIAEGIPLCLDVMELDRWGKQNRIAGCLKALQQYGGAAKPLLPQLAQLKADLQSHAEAKSLQANLELLRETRARIENDTNPPILRGLSPTP